MLALSVHQTNDANNLACSDMAVLCLLSPARLSRPAYVLHKSCLGRVLTLPRQQAQSCQLLAAKAASNSSSSNEVSSFFFWAEVQQLCSCNSTSRPLLLCVGRDQAPPPQQGST